jgi:hypothetical protein
MRLPAWLIQKGRSAMAALFAFRLSLLAVACASIPRLLQSVPTTAVTCAPAAASGGGFLSWFRSPPAQTPNDMLAAIPQPFVEHVIPAFRPFVEVPKLMSKLYQRRNKALCTVLQNNRTSADLVAQAVRAGVVIGELGIDFSAAIGARAPPSHRAIGPRSLTLVPPPNLTDTAFRAVCEAFLEPDIRYHTEQLEKLSPSVFPRAILRTDLPQHKPSEAGLRGLRGSSLTMYGQLARDGYVKVARWPALDMRAITKLAMAALDDAEAKLGRRLQRKPPILTTQPDGLEPLLRPLLASASLHATVNAYLGTTAESSACVYGYTALRLNDGINPSNYISSVWHHDRAGRRCGCEPARACTAPRSHCLSACARPRAFTPLIAGRPSLSARRLKLFIFLHDVDPVKGRPTVIAVGTHQYVWYSALGDFDSRYNASWIADNFDIEPLGGPRGGGFLFDTNALHVGSFEGSEARSVVILEIDRQDRCAQLALPFSPCPSAGQHTFTTASQQRIAIPQCRPPNIQLR